MSSSDRKYDYLVNPDQENVVTQIWLDGKWQDYVRSTIAQARRHIAVNTPGKFRMVDWIWKDVIES